MSDETKTLSLRIHGRVQGVWYRGWTVKQARALGLAGWVCNRPDGSVEALLGGDASSVDEMIGEMRDGPAAARVDGIDRTPADAATLPRGFEIR